MSTIKVVFFDVGATLLTPAQNEGTVFFEIAKQLAVRIDPHEVRAKVPQMYELYEQLYEQDDSFWSDDVRARAIWIEMYEFLASLLAVPRESQRPLAEAVYRYYFSPTAWKTYDDVLPTLDALQARGMRLGLISNWDSTLVPIMQGLQMEHYFETILSSAVVQLHKPMPEIFHLALSSLDVSASEAMHVGDHPYADVEGARGVGITPVLLDRDEQHPHHKGLRVKSLSQICSLL